MDAHTLVGIALLRDKINAKYFMMKDTWRFIVKLDDKSNA